MTVSLFVMLFFTAFCWIGLKSAQVLNTTFKHYWAIPVVGLFLICAEVSVVDEMADKGLGLIVIPLWLGATCGSWTSMWVHSLVNKDENLRG